MRNGVGPPDGMITSSFYLVLSVCLSFCFLFFLRRSSGWMSSRWIGSGGAKVRFVHKESLPPLGGRRSTRTSRRFSTSHRVPHAAQFPRAVRCRCQCIEPEIKKTIRFSDWRSEIQAGCAVSSCRNCSVFRGCSYSSFTYSPYFPRALQCGNTFTAISSTWRLEVCPRDTIPQPHVELQCWRKRAGRAA
jgi:hypothetical protein